MDTVHECDRQTDRQTDGRTDRITITDAVQTASHGKNDAIENTIGYASADSYRNFKLSNNIFAAKALLVYIT